LKVVHIITALTDGGAEGVLYRLCKFDTQTEHVVISMMDENKYGPLLKKEGIKVHCLNMQQGKVSLSGLIRLFKLLLQQRPDVVQTWMYHADLIGGLIAKFAGVKNVYWNVRRTNLEKENSKRSRFFVTKACALVSSWIPKKIIYCARRAKIVHEGFGYAVEKGKVIGNGCDTSLFYPFDVSRKQLTANMQFDSSVFLIGFVGRYAPEKDHSNLFDALSILKSKDVAFHCLLVGQGVDQSNSKLLSLLQSTELKEQVSLLGQINDIPVVLNCLDLHVLPSSSEGFPNVLVEAMACGTPCVSTDVGDAALIVGEMGWLIPPKDPQALAISILQAIEEKQNNKCGWFHRKRICRNRVIDNFSVNQMIKGYYQTWLNSE